jgi:hypothetical protein
VLYSRAFVCRKRTYILGLRDEEDGEDENATTQTRKEVVPSSPANSSCDVAGQDDKCAADYSLDGRE